MASNRKKIVHIITGLNTGGAEMMLFKVLSANTEEYYSSVVISLTDIGAVGQKIVNLGVPVCSLDMKRRSPSLYSLYLLIKILRKECPDLIQTWMFHADLIGLLAAKLTGCRKIIWGIRCSDLKHSFATSFIVKLCALLSGFPDKVIFNSMAGRKYHLEYWGYKPRSHVVIQNGFDLELFKKNPESKFRLCRNFNLDDKAFIVGGAGRFDISKDYQTFLSVVKEVHQQEPKIRFIICGKGVSVKNSYFRELIDLYALQDVIFLLDENKNMPEYMSSLDLFLLTSISEGFPNVIGEAMACATPCVVTNSGDSAFLVGETGFVYPVKDFKGLADGIIKFYRMSQKKRDEYGMRSRQRIVDNFSMDTVNRQYQELYREVLTGNTRCAV